MCSTWCAALCSVLPTPQCQVFMMQWFSHFEMCTCQQDIKVAWYELCASFACASAS